MKNRNVIRALSGMAAAAVLCASLPMMNLSAAQTLAGDTDLDGAAGVTDIVLLTRYIHGFSPLGQDAFDNADLDADGTVDVLDLALLKRLVTGTAPAADPVYIHLAGTAATAEADENGAVQIDGNTVKITASGLYYVDGSFEDGQIYIETPADDIADVELVLTDTTFTNTTRQAIFTSAATGSDKTKLTLVGDNTFTDTAAAAYADGAAVIYANNKLTVTRTSTGTLTVNSYRNDGLHSEKKLNLNGGTITIDTDTAPADASIIPDADGISSDKSIEIEGAVLDLDTSGDGIKSDAGVYVFDGDVSIKAGADAMQALTEIAVSGGTVVASGDRGFRLGAAGLLNLTGGTVLATATDYQVGGETGVTIDTSGTTQTTVLLNLAAEWKKANAITVGDLSYTSRKKYDYVLISDSRLAQDGSYAVTIGGSPATHSDTQETAFNLAGIWTEFVNVFAEAPAV